MPCLEGDNDETTAVVVVKDDPDTTIMSDMSSSCLDVDNVKVVPASEDGTIFKLDPDPDSLQEADSSICTYR